MYPRRVAWKPHLAPAGPCRGALRISFGGAPEATWAAAPIIFNVPERAELVRLTCTPVDGLSDEEKLTRRIRVIELRAALCRRQEGRRGMPKAKTTTKEPKNKTESFDADPDGPKVGRETEYFPLKCKPTQCKFCMGDDRLPYHYRVFAYKKLNKLRNHVEKRHLSKIAPNDPVHSTVLPSTMAFKRHTQVVHKIELRA